MPKADKAASVNPTLRRNQACHQCRKRKLKCDASRPVCSTCIRSFRHLQTHASPDIVVPSEPICTWDEDPNAQDVSQSKVDQLEKRIKELELLLRNQDVSARNVDTNLLVPEILDSSSQLENVNLGQFMHHSMVGQDIGTSSTTNYDNTPLSPEELVGSQWPPNLPTSELLSHLVDSFFASHPHATRLLHQSTFTGTLFYSPDHPKFPAIPLLHAICAMSSLYSTAVSSPPNIDFSTTHPGDLFSTSRIKPDQLNSFADKQARYAKDTADALFSSGEALFQVLQAYIVLAWFYSTHGRWSEFWTTTGHIMRMTVPLGLSICPPFQSLTNSHRPVSLLRPATTVIEDEMRRNTYWLAFSLEKQLSSSIGWASCVDESDISQMMPVRGDHFLQGTLITPRSRQWAHTRELLVSHPENQVDSFILYVKATMLLSRVKNFNLRFRSKNYAGLDVSYITQPSNVPFTLGKLDPRQSPAFIEMENTTNAFLASFPPYLNSPFKNAGLEVDNHLLTTVSMCYLAMMMLHERHADVRQKGCISACRILEAARSILELIRNLELIHYNISLLDWYCVFSWFYSGRIIRRFYYAAAEANTIDTAVVFKGELDFIGVTLSRVADHIPVARYYLKWLESEGDLINYPEPENAMRPLL